MSLTLFSLWTDNFHLFAPFPRSEEKGNRRNFRETESSSFSLPRRVLCFHRLAATQVERDARPSVKFCSVALEFCIIRSLFFGGFSFALSLASAEGELVCRRISAVYEFSKAAAICNVAKSPQWLCGQSWYFLGISLFRICS